jgi:hypothetical protein
MPNFNQSPGKAWVPSTLLRFLSLCSPYGMLQVRAKAWSYIPVLSAPRFFRLAGNFLHISVSIQERNHLCVLYVGRLLDRKVTFGLIWSCILTCLYSPRETHKICIKLNICTRNIKVRIPFLSWIIPDLGHWFQNVLLGLQSDFDWVTFPLHKVWKIQCFSHVFTVCSIWGQFWVWFQESIRPGWNWSDILYRSI